MKTSQQWDLPIFRFIYVQWWQVKTDIIKHNVGKYCPHEWYSNWFGDICRKRDKNFDGFEQRKDKSGNHRLIDQLLIKVIVFADVHNDGSFYPFTMDITRLHLNPVHENDHSTQLNHPHLNAGQSRLRQTFLLLQCQQWQVDWGKHS